MNTIRLRVVRNGSIQAIGCIQHLRSRRGFVTDLDQVLDDDLIAGIRVPTLIVHRTNDRSVSMDHAMHAKNNIPNSEPLVVDNKWGQSIWIGEESETITSAVADFFVTD